MDFAAQKGSGGSGWGIKMAFLLFLLLGFVDVSWGRTRGSMIRHTLEIKSHLRSLNRRAVKFTKSGDGDIIDCARVAHQPGFDHPLFKNVWSLSIQQQNEFCRSQIWVLGGTFDEDLNSIEGGLQNWGMIQKGSGGCSLEMDMCSFIGTFTEPPNRCDVQMGKGDDWGSYFFYGDPHCP